MFVAMLVAGIWIAVFCTAPQLLGGYVWKRFGFATELPLRHLLQVSLNSLAVLSLVVLSGRSARLVPKRPASPAVFLLFVPLMAVNLTRGPMLQAGAAFVLVTLASTLMTGFWEEFLFRGMIQDRLAVIGGRLSMVLTALMFGLIHSYAGILPVCIAFSIGLAFSLARDQIGQPLDSFLQQFGLLSQDEHRFNHRVEVVSNR